MKDEHAQSPLIIQSDHEEEGHWFNDRLFSTRTILLSGPVDDSLARRTVQSLLLLQADDPGKPIDLIINSPGGSVTSGFAIFDVIRFIKPSVRCISAGLTASIATIIYSAVEKKSRFSLPNSRFLLHQPLLGFTMFGPASDLEITAKEMDKTRAKLNNTLAEACNQPLEKIAKDTMRDYWLGPSEALDYGLVGSVINSRSELP